jgi:hypothetical protein
MAGWFFICFKTAFIHQYYFFANFFLTYFGTH